MQETLQEKLTLDLNENAMNFTAYLSKPNHGLLTILVGTTKGCTSLPEK
jgi:hypothetical protein